MKAVLAAGVLGLVPLAVSADHLGAPGGPLLENGNWSVWVTKDAIQHELYCAAWTENAEGQTFGFGSLVGTGRLVAVFDERWLLENRDVNFHVDIDGSRWLMSGWSEGSYLRDDDNDPTNHYRFVREVGSGRTLTVFGEAGERLASFSLEGAAEALDTLAWCENHIGFGQP